MLTNQPAHIIERQALVATDGEALVVMAPGSEEQELAAGAGLRSCRRGGDGPRRPSSPCRSCARQSRDLRSGAASTASSRRRTLSDSHRPRASCLQRYAFSFFPASIRAEKMIGSVGMGRSGRSVFEGKKSDKSLKIIAKTFAYFRNFSYLCTIKENESARVSRGQPGGLRVVQQRLRSSA